MGLELIRPHGNKLTLCLLEGIELEEALKKAASLPQLFITSEEVSDLIMIAIGAFSPIKGFMKEDDYSSVIESMRLKDGTLWPIPITLSITSEDYQKYKAERSVEIGHELALVDQESNGIIGVIRIEDIFTRDKSKESEAVFGTSDINHPGVKKLYERGEVCIGGKVKVFSEGGYPEKFPQYARPSEVREIFAQKGWEKIVAFQTRNPIHRSHEYLTKVVLETFDGLFIHPIVGKLKQGDIPADIRMVCYQALLDNYYPKERVVLKVYPMEMRYAGPKEAVLHAIIRQNYGCSHIIIGRDHAGVGNYYAPFDAQRIFDGFNNEDLKIKPIKMDWTFYCSKCSSMASFKTCNHDKSFHKLISGTKLRQMLAAGKRPPEYISRPEVSDILIDYYQSLERKKK